ncbi:MAG: hypothetical protein RIC55_21395 [Pirellulaceae bacterium]
MYFQYGDYRHADGEVNLSLNKRVHRNARGFAAYTTWTLQVEGVLIADGQSATELQASIRQQVNTLESAYGHDGLDAGLFHDDGSPSSHYLDSSTSLGGVRVAGIEFDKDNRDGQYATGRSYRITLEADFPNPAVTFQQWSESLRIIGTGGPRFVHVQTLRGAPQKQLVHQRTIVRATQTGTAVGLRGYPSPPPPIFPAAELVDRREVSRDSPRNLHGAFIDWPVHWTFHFETAGPLVGAPNRR